MTNTSTTHPDNDTIVVEPGTIVLFSDLICPFAHVIINRIHTAREQHGIDVVIDHHAFPIELLNQTPGTRHGSDSEIPTIGALEPEAGWQLWQGPDYHYPNTVLLAFEAVQAAKQQSLDAGERLDRALRRAFWADSRPIQLHHEIIAIAADVPGLDNEQLEQDLRRGVGRSAIFDDLDIIRTGVVTMSPHLFLADGTNHTNPGIDVHWQGDWAKGFPVVDSDEPSAVAALLNDQR
jgi:predicted DsbA family dithiol-disulfide isomerase